LEAKPSTLTFNSNIPSLSCNKRSVYTMVRKVSPRRGVRALAGCKVSATPCPGTYGVRLRTKASQGVRFVCGGRHRWEQREGGKEWERDRGVSCGGRHR
jgi:hypothetical protein